jgi:hypothetical protein
LLPQRPRGAYPADANATDARRVAGRECRGARRLEEWSVVPTFVPGLALAATTYREAVRPILDVAFPGLAYSAALLGAGSEVLGYDTARSTDHGWGPRVLLFLHPADARAHGRRITEALAQRMPRSVDGWGTNFSRLEPGGSMVLAPAGDGPANHRVEVVDLDAWLPARLGVDPRSGMRARDWLAVPGQLLLEVTAGAVFHDGLGELEPLRAALAWYPEDVWRYLLACQWRRVAQEEAFPGRCAEVGDDLGSSIVTARLVRDLMRLALLIERRYPPYSKWLGTAFAQLHCAPPLRPLLAGALAATAWPQREEPFCRAYEMLARAHNDLGLADPVESTVRPFHDRPFRVLGADRLADATLRAITDPEVLALPAYIGGVDQFVDSTDVLSSAGRARGIAGAALA